MPISFDPPSGTLRQVGADFETQYGYAPWLVESFVDTEHFLGTCYKAAN